MLPDVHDTCNSNDCSVVDRLSIVTSDRIGPLLLSLLKFANYEHSK